MDGVEGALYVWRAVLWPRGSVMRGHRPRVPALRPCFDLDATLDLAEVDEPPGEGAAEPIAVVAPEEDLAALDSLLEVERLSDRQEAYGR